MANMIRKTILAELKRRDWTVYRFAKELDGKVNMRVVYQYLSEGQDTGTEIAAQMLHALDLVLIRQGGRKRKAKKKSRG